MKKNRLAVLAIIALMLNIVTATPAVAQTNSTPSGWKPSFTLTSLIANKYPAFGSGAILYDRPVIQSDIFVSFHNGLYADLWSSKSFEGSWGSNLGDEIDYGVGWAGSIGKGFNLDIGVTYFDEPMAFTFGAGDILYSHIKVGRSLGQFIKPLDPVVVFASFENYTTMPRTSFEGGNLYSIGASTGIKLSRTLHLSSTTIASYDDGGFGLRSGMLFRQNLELDVQIGKHVKLILPRLASYLPTMGDSRKPELVVSGGVSISIP